MIEPENCELILCMKSESLYIVLNGKKQKIGWWYFMDHPSDNVDTTGDLDFLRFRIESYFIDGDEDDFEDVFVYSENVKTEIVDFINSVFSR